MKGPSANKRAEQTDDRSVAAARAGSTCHAQNHKSWWSPLMPPAPLLQTQPASSLAQAGAPGRLALASGSLASRTVAPWQFATKLIPAFSRIF